MSAYTDKEYFYYLDGRDIHLYKLLGTVGGNRISQSGVFRTHRKELMYPDEDIADGLRIEHTSYDQIFVSEQYESRGYYSGTDVSFGQSSNTSIESANAGFSFNGLHKNHRIKLRVKGSDSNDGDYHINTNDPNHSAGRLVILSTGSARTGNLVSETAGNLITIEQLPSFDDNNTSPISTSSYDTTLDKNGNPLFDTPDENHYVNLPRNLCLAVVDYCKAMVSEQQGDINKKEYFMKEFFGKLGDSESNKRNISMMFPSNPFAVR